ncbi:MAG TPA: ABC transporter substrate-binding protein, partial [Burkholderiales bacterium]|nr:ABC transporter substrate-binding protein [Burkholderiales bacterium]
MKRIIAAAAALFAGAAFAQGQGVSKNEIVIGSMQDLSGPIVAFSKQLKYGMEMRVEEINAQGG